jgi:Malic enzyme, NAD binding domain
VGLCVRVCWRMQQHQSRIIAAPEQLLCPPPSHFPPGMERQGLSPEAAAAQFWVLDANGLITTSRQGTPAHVARFARRGGSSSGGKGEQEGATLLDVVRDVRPTVLLGLAGGFGTLLLLLHCEGVGFRLGFCGLGCKPWHGAWQHAVT